MYFCFTNYAKAFDCMCGAAELFDVFWLVDI